MTDQNPPASPAPDTASRPDGVQAIKELIDCAAGIAHPGSELARLVKKARRATLPVPASREATPSKDVAAGAGLRETLTEWQDTATAYSEAVIALGGHARAQHESPQQYDSESGMACIAPGCIAALATPEARSPRPETPRLTRALHSWLRHKDWCNVKTDDPPNTERCKCGLAAAYAEGGEGG